MGDYSRARKIYSSHSLVCIFRLELAPQDVRPTSMEHFLAQRLKSRNGRTILARNAAPVHWNAVPRI